MKRLRRPHSPPPAPAGPAARTASTVPAACQRRPMPLHDRRTDRRREARAAEQIVVEEVQMAARQAVDLGEGIIDGLHVERPAAARRTPPCSRSRRRCGQPRLTTSELGTRYRSRLMRSRRAERAAPRRERSSRTVERGRGEPARKSARNAGHVSSPGRRRRCRRARRPHAGRLVGCSPPRHT